MQLNNTSGHHVSHSMFERLQNLQITISNRKFCGVTEHWSTAAGPRIVQSLVISSDPDQCATDRWVMMSAEGGVGGLFTALCVCEEGRPCTCAVFLPGAQLRLAAAYWHWSFLRNFPCLVFMISSCSRTVVFIRAAELCHVSVAHTAEVHGWTLLPPARSLLLDLSV